MSSDQQPQFVYIVTREYDYEGFTILAIFDDPDVAQAFADRQEYRADGINVEKWTVNGTPDGFQVTP